MTDKPGRVVIVGAGGHGKEAADCLAASQGQYDILGFVDDDSRLTGTTVNGLPVLGTTGWLEDTRDKIHCVVAIGANDIRKEIAERIVAFGHDFLTVVHPEAWVSPHARLGRGCMIWPGAVIMANAVIGDHVIVNTAASVSHDAVLGDYVNINPGARVNGNVELGEGAFLGSGALTVQGRSIGPWAFVTIGAVVTKDIPAHAKAAGAPARVIGKNVSSRAELEEDP